MNFRLLLLIFFISHLQSRAQSSFEFKGQVNKDFRSSIAYLNKVEDLNKKDRFFTENIIQESHIDDQGNFSFKGYYLPTKNAFYKIYIDNCSREITHPNHILDRCQNHVAIFFVANNSSQLSFPLNNLDQIFCELKSKSNNKNIIQEIDSFESQLLMGLNSAKSDKQRQLVYQNYFTKLKKHSQTYKEPLAQLYAFYLYSNPESFARQLLLKDIKTSNYYTDLRNKLESEYPNALFTKQYKSDLSLLTPKKQILSSSLIIYVLSVALFISLCIIFYLIKTKSKQPLVEEINPTKDYRKILTNQEQKVFELMHSGLTNKAIAQTLFVSLSTIKSHINNIYTKLNISSRKDVSSFF